jgi:NADH dehydrogenase I D subunit
MEDVKPIHTDTFTLNFGPSHPATHGTLHLVMELDGERAIKITPHIGYLHTGFEKLAEYLTYNQFITLSDRMNYISPLCNNIGFALAAEKLMGISAPPRAQYIRVILAELSRIADHLVCIGMQAVDIGAFTAFIYGFIEREKLYNIFEAVAGARLTTSYTRVGGLFRDVPSNFQDMVKDFIKGFPKAWKEIDGLLTRNKIWLGRTQGVGAITKEEAINWGLTGPVLRAAGVEWDIRKAEPYLVYDQVEFDVPVGEYGDTYDRYMIRMYEIKESIRIVEQLIDKIPDGPFNYQNPKYTLPDKKEVYTTIEGLIHLFKLEMEGHGFEAPEGEVYMATESPNGELGFYIVSDGKNKPYRLRVRPPSFVHFSVFPRLMEGHFLSDAVAILGSLNIIAGELDR